MSSDSTPPATVPLLQNLTQTERDQVANVLDAEDFQTGFPIAREGDRRDAMYFLEEGKAEATMAALNALGAEPGAPKENPGDMDDLERAEIFVKLQDALKVDSNLVQNLSALMAWLDRSFARTERS